MLAPLSVPTVEVSDLRSAISSLRGTRDRFGALVGKQLDELDWLRTRLAEYAATVDAERAQVIKLRSELDQERARSDDSDQAEAAGQKQIAELTAQLAAARAELASRPGKGAGDAKPLADMQQQLAALTRKHQEAEQELETARRQAGRLAGAAVELMDVRTELESARAELQKLRAQGSAGHGAGNPALEAELCEAQKQQASLELELDTLRARLAEVTEEAAETKRIVTEERAEWAGEFKQMRRAMERQTSHAVEQAAIAATAPPPPAAAAPASPGPPKDPVLGSVMAQFEMLQKELGRRRTSNAARK